MPEGINHLRLGASIVLAESPTPPGLYELLNNDAFTLTADIIEAKVKPSRPYGVSGEDAFGRRPVFDNEDKPSRRLILSIGPRRHLAGRLDPDRSASEGDQRQ